MSKFLIWLTKNERIAYFFEQIAHSLIFGQKMSNSLENQMSEFPALDIGVTEYVPVQCTCGFSSFFGFIQTFFAVSRAVGFRFLPGYSSPIFKCFRFVFPLAFQHRIPNCSTTKTHEATSKTRHKVENDGERGRGMTKYFGAHCIPSLHARTKFWFSLFG